MKKFFNERNKKVLDLTLLSDSLGHSLRENVSLFSIDDAASRATFVTESNNIIEGTYYLDNNILLDDITVESGEIFVEDEKFESGTKTQISNFIDSMYSDNLVEASDLFDDLIDSWSSRVKFNSTVDRLKEQSESFNNTFNIVNTDEFGRFVELSENISKFLSENKEEIQQIAEIRNACRLSNAVAQAFNIPRKTLEQLQEEGTFEVNRGESRDIYEMVCRQELVKKEILESKNSFDTVWVTEPSMANLASKIFEDDEEVVARSLVEAFVNIPYLALISKKQLSNTIQNSLSVIEEEAAFSKADLKSFVSTLFEMKKPLKMLVSNILQEKYGVNVNNLKDTPTFKTLLNTQSIIFESLAKLSPRGSSIRQSLTEMSELLKSKNGVEAIDVNAGLRYLFENSGFDDIYIDDSVQSSFTLTEGMDNSSETVDMILNELILEKEAVMEPEQEEEEEVAEAPEETQEEPTEDEVAQGMTARELMKAFKDVEDLVSGTEMEDE